MCLYRHRKFGEREKENKPNSISRKKKKLAASGRGKKKLDLLSGLGGEKNLRLGGSPSTVEKRKRRTLRDATAAEVRRKNSCFLTNQPPSSEGGITSIFKGRNRSSLPGAGLG